MNTDNQTLAPVVDIDLSAALANFMTLQKAGEAEGAAVVKCDGYGLGAVAFARTLAIHGQCKKFFVAYPEEGRQLRHQLNDIDPTFEIFVFNGPTPVTLSIFSECDLTPVINSIEQGSLWAKYHPERSCVLHIDTGMNRLGLEVHELEKLKNIPFLNVSMVMSHLACADVPNTKKNDDQRCIFDAISADFPSAQTSLASTGGTFLGSEFKSNIVRLGIGLYGVSTSGAPDPRLKQVATLTAPVLQLRNVEAGETTGYGETYKFCRPSTLAAVSVGYGDGYLRAASNSASCWVNDTCCPVVGRVSMDITVFDVTDIKEKIRAGDRVQLFGNKMPIETVAGACGTIGYELLTGLGPRVMRRYFWEGKPASKNLLSA